MACGKVDLGENAQDSQLIGGSGVGRAGASPCFRLCRDACASERVRNSTNKNGMRTHGNGARGGAAGFCFAFGQDLLRNFRSSAPRSAELGWEFRSGCAGSFDFQRGCGNPAG